MQTVSKAIRRRMTSLRKRVGGIRKRIRAEREVAVAFNKESPPPLLIYQMGKVGSRTVRRTLKDAHLPGRILHLHSLSDSLPELVNKHIEAGLYPYHLALGLAVRRKLSNLDYLECKVISLVRDPIARSLSAVFQVPRLVGAELLDEAGHFKVARTVEFLEQRLQSPGAFEFTFGWFDREIKSVFGIDVFSGPFDKEQGWTIYRRNGIELLVLRMEDLSSIGPYALASFLGAPEPIPLRQDNITQNKHSGDEYRAVREQFRLSVPFCESVYASRYARHFYSDTMIEAFMEKWARNDG